VVANAAWPAVLPDAVILALGAAAFVLTVVSGADYVLIYVRKAVRVARARRLATP